jgi:hypothetical protein
MDFDTQLRLAICRHIADTGTAPTVADMVRTLGTSDPDIRDSYRRLYGKRVLVLQPDGESIRMVPPFSGVPTQHRVKVRGKQYFANCAWDALGIAAALHAEAEVCSRCEQSLEQLRFHVRQDGPEPEPCVIHFAVPAAHWWDDIVTT